MAEHIENIVVGKPIYDEKLLLSKDLDDWNSHESSLTVYDTERNLPRLLVKYEFMKSTSEVRRNKPQLVKELDKPDFIELKIGKKKLWIVVGK